MKQKHKYIHYSTHKQKYTQTRTQSSHISDRLTALAEY